MKKKRLAEGAAEFDRRFDEGEDTILMTLDVKRR